MTAVDLEKYFCFKNKRLPKKIFNRYIKKLIENGELVYTYEFGCSFLEPSFEKPVRISDYIVVKPEKTSFPAEKDDIVITLQKGASFGSGRHPSTRLAVKAMESILMPMKTEDNGHRIALDIGTGSGILAIASVLMGMKKAIGLDIDPCSISEAKQNVHLNKLTGKVMIDSNPFESINKTFFLILANLRLPTLADIYASISDSLEEGGFAVFSGLKTEETDPIVNLYKKRNIRSINTFTEKGWASIVLHKTG